MKLQILTNDQEQIYGYKAYPINQIGSINEEVVNNECDSILATNTLNYFTESELSGFLGLLVGKLRLNGEITVSGIDQRLFCKGVISNSIEPSEANKVVAMSKSLVGWQPVANLLRSAGLEIEHTRISGITYEIKARRK